MEASTSGDVPCTNRITTLCLPKLAQDVTGARLLRTYRGPGEHFTAGEPLYECETDKVTVDVDAPVSGELECWLVAEGATVAEGEPVARIRVAAEGGEGTPGGGESGDGASGDGAPPACRAPGDEEPGVSPRPAAGPQTSPPHAVAGPPVRVSPLARKHARLRGLSVEDLASIPRRGTMLTPADIDRHLDGAGAGQEPAAAREPAPPQLEDGAAKAPADFDDVPLTEAQQRLNRALDRSRAEVTASSVSVCLDAATLRRAAARLRVESGTGFVSDFQALVRLAALAARDHPRLRARRIGAGGLRIFRRVNAGVAVATAEGDLVVAGLPGADEGGFADFSARWATALESALSGHTTVDSTTTVLVSSLDDEGALHATPVVVPPAVATLFLGATSPGPDGTRLLTLAYDHGVLNGREATRYLADVRRHVRRTADAGTGPRADSPTEAEPARPTTDPATVHRLAELVRDVTGRPVDVDRPFGELGLTSSAAVRLAAAVRERLGARLPATAVWHHPTPRALAAAVDAARPAPAGTPAGEDVSDGPAGEDVSDGPAGEDVSDGPAGEDVSDGAVPSRAVRDSAAPNDVAGPGDRAVIVGMACAFPGAEGPDAFWELLVRRECAVREIPAGRLADFVPDVPEGGDRAVPPPLPRAGLLDAAGDFDAEFFGIPPRQARSMDPQQRLLLELSRHALEDAGLVPERLAGTRTGVFVGTSSYDFRERTVREGHADGYATLGTFPAFLANRISYHYDLTGPSITVDTACSASLTALALAVSAIERGECETALVGGVNLLGNGFNQAAFQRAGMLSPEGLSRAFDAAADGYVRGEGAGWLVLRSLRRADADGDPLLAVVLGAAANHGGR
ncbi:hypothetical protein CLM62_23750, partial [Streptomyces sp. SA15]|uniref:beta-ketoacyl synthase N-terminal-like domain-containing protein n=1 Tax=Streptomyces sp. SA15 TaxID=934019 RepID=UPI000BD6BD09